MKAVRSALYRLIELPTVGMAEFGAEGVLENRKLLHNVVGHYQEWTGNALVVVIYPSMVKLLSRGLCPPTEGPDPAPIPPLLATPACSKDRFNTPEPPAAVGKSCKP